MELKMGLHFFLNEKCWIRLCLCCVLCCVVLCCVWGGEEVGLRQRETRMEYVLSLGQCKQSAKAKFL